MWIMTFPACKRFIIGCVMYTLLKLRFDFLEMEPCEFRIIPVTVYTVELTFHPELTGMRKGIIICRMTVCTGKTTVI